jgi:hypothetical protein
MKITDRPSTWFPVLPDLACWSTLMANCPARCTCSPAGGPALAICARRSLTRLVTPVSSPPPTLDSTCSCSACWSADRPRSRTATTVFTEPRSCWRVVSQLTSAAVRVPWLTAATTGTGMRLVDPNGAASCAACSLGASAGRKALLLPCVTLLSEGRNFGTAKPAISQAAMTTQRNLTANAPIPPNMAWMRTALAYSAWPHRPGPGDGDRVALRGTDRLPK